MRDYESQAWWDWYLSDGPEMDDASIEQEQADNWQAEQAVAAFDAMTPEEKAQIPTTDAF